MGHMKTLSFIEFTPAVRRLVFSTVLFVGLFAGLLWLLGELMNWVFAVLNATH